MSFRGKIKQVNLEEHNNFLVVLKLQLVSSHSLLD